MQIIVQPFSGIDLRHRQPRSAICQWQEEIPPIKYKNHDHSNGSPGHIQCLPFQLVVHRAETSLDFLRDFPLEVLFRPLDAVIVDHWVDVENELDKGASDEASGEMSGKVVVEEERTAHKL